jgi:putative MATE family efflux protein
MDRSKRLGEGAIPSLLLTFSVPAVVGMLAQSLYNLVDRVVLGHAVGSLGIAGTVVAFPPMLILMGFGMLVGLGASTLISIRLGQQRRQDAERALGNAAVLSVLVLLAVSAVGLLFLDPILILFGASDEVLPYARDYMQIILLGSVFQGVGFGLNAVIRGEGSPRIAMFTMLLGAILNAVLAAFFVLGLGLGMKGAATATVIAQAVSAAWVVAYFLGGKSLLRLRLENLRLRWPTCRTILATGSPPCAMQIAAAVLNGILIHQLDAYGGVGAVSALGIVYGILLPILMPIFGINQGAQPIIGYNYGAAKFDRVRRTLLLAVTAATAITMTGFAGTMLFPEALVRLFNRNEPELISLGSHAMQVCLMMLPIVGFQIVSASYFQAIGKPGQAMVLTLSRQVFLLIPAVLVLPRYFGLDGVWAAMPVADLGSAVLTGAWLFWELRHLDRRHAAPAEVAGDAAL